MLEKAHKMCIGHILRAFCFLSNIIIYFNFKFKNNENHFGIAFRMYA